MTHPAPSAHGFTTKGLHWVSAGLIVYGYYKGLDDVSQLADPALLRTEILFALVLGAVFLVRLIWTQKVAGATRLPDTAPRWEHRASRAVHLGLYAGVFGIVLTGLGIALAYVTPALSGFVLEAVLFLHQLALTTTQLLLVAHIAGALWHKFVRRDGILETMTGKLPF